MKTFSLTNKETGEDVATNNICLHHDGFLVELKLEGWCIFAPNQEKYEVVINES